MEAREAHGTAVAAAMALNIPRPTLAHRLREAARRGIAPGHFNAGTAPGYFMTKVTVQRGPSGEVERTWERQAPEDHQREEAMQAALQAMCAEIKPVDPIPAPAQSMADLLALYTLRAASPSSCRRHRTVWVLLSSSSRRRT